MAWAKRPTAKLVLAWAFALLLFAAADPSLPFLAAGLVPVLLGAIVRIWACGHLEKNKKLTTAGPYAWVQNPLYLGTFLIMLGFCIMARRWEVLALGALVFFAYYIPFKKRREGDRLRELFGEAYDDYARSVPVLFPIKLSRYPRRASEAWNGALVFANSEHGTTVAVLVGIAAMVLRLAFPSIPRPF